MQDCFRSAGIACLFLVFSQVHAYADSLAYAIGGTFHQHSTFGLLDLNTGAFSPISTFSLFAEDLAVSSNGTIYVLTTPFGAPNGVGQEFSTISPVTGAITNIASESTLNSMVFSSDGTLYVTNIPTIGGPQTLDTINVATGATSTVTNLSAPITSTAGQLRFIGNTLYTTDYNTPSGLYTVDLSTGAGTLVGSTGLNMDNGLGAVVNGQLVDTASVSSGSQIFFIDPATGVATPGAALSGFSTVPVFALAPEIALSNVAGGSASAPTPLFSAQPIGEVTGSIGPSGATDYYSFSWGGGSFTATASITGATSAASYLFSEGLAGACTEGGSATLNNADSFTATISIANLPAGQYCIGLNANSASDPAYTLLFNTSLPAQTPEPGSFLLLLTGCALIGARLSGRLS